jgi:hypothetical protein
VEIAFPLAVFLIKPPVEKHFHWPLALAALKNASENSFRTVTIELLCTSGNRKRKEKRCTSSAVAVLSVASWVFFH